MKRSTLNLALLVVAAGLGAAVYFSQEPEKKDAPLTAMTADAIDKIRIEHPGQPALVLAKSGKDWKLLEPVQAPVDEIEINGVLSLATLGVKSSLNAADVALADLGLAPAQYSVTLNDTRLELGNTEPLNFQRYIRIGDKVQLTDDPPGTALDADYSDLVSKQLLPADAEIVQIALPGLTVARAADGKSWSVVPLQAGGSSDQTQKLVDGWKNARAMWNALQAEPLPAKMDEIVVSLKDGSAVKFAVAEIEPQLILVRPDLKVRYTLSHELVSTLLHIPAEAPKPAAAATPTGLPSAPQ